MSDRAFEQVLEECLRELRGTEDVERLTRRYPQYADRLRPLLETARATRNHYLSVPQPAGGLEAGRARFLQAAAERGVNSTTKTKRERRLKMKLGWATRLVGALLVVVIAMAGIGGGIAWAASESLPGDVLYPTKWAVEDLQLSVSASPASQVALALQFAQERTAEIEALVQAGRPVPEEVIARMEQHLQRAMNRAAWAAEEDVPGLLQGIAQQTRTQAQALQRVREMAPEGSQARLEYAQRVCQRQNEAATVALGDPQTFRLRYQDRENMPEDVTPPEPPAVEPPGSDQGQQGPGGPNESPDGTPQGNRQQGPGGPNESPDGTPQGNRQQGQQGNPSGTPSGTQNQNGQDSGGQGGQGNGGQGGQGNGGNGQGGQGNGGNGQNGGDADGQMEGNQP